MSLSLYEPFYDLDRFFSDFMTPEWPGTTWTTDRRRGGRGRDVAETGPRTMRPTMDLHEDPKENTVTAVFELPGVKKEDINIDVNNNRLTVSTEIKKDEEREESGYAIRERRFGRYQRTLQLPEGVKDSDIKAKMEHGLLMIQFPKSGPEQPPKKITIS